MGGPCFLSSWSTGESDDEESSDGIDISGSPPRDNGVDEKTRVGHGGGGGGGSNRESHNSIKSTYRGEWGLWSCDSSSSSSSSRRIRVLVHLLLQVTTCYYYYHHSSGRCRL